MKNEQTAKKIGYNWFLERAVAGKPVPKDVFLYDRELWDSMQKQLNESGENVTHDDVKELVKRLDKSGYLGGIAHLRTFEDQCQIVTSRQRNQAETGHPLGVEGIVADVSKYAEKTTEARLAEYYREPHWQKRSLTYRESVGWVCELCLRKHRRGSRSLVTHHRSYRLEDGGPAFFKETDRELLAVCSGTCHELSDLARYVAVGRIDTESVGVALSPLFATVR